ncbi:hydroxymethylpyrimidine/phosphomethylpyrimidine kinase [Aminobacter sp. BE322]|uniref:hydroxymethylpyrimidine/phosphomethylpyrimidine kinase n=1 Tax=unclassified Aminobacter TaxID=2644704 RepID=UPI003D1C4311
MAGSDGSVAMTPHVLIVAGSDSSGGAGIVRDVETVSAFGLRCSLAVTAVTVQTHAAVERIEQMPPELVAEQMQAAFGADLAESHKDDVAGILPPPLTPPHKGEGNLPIVVATKVFEHQRWAIAPQRPPPPCGEGLGVGVTSNARAPATPVAAVKIGMLGTAAIIDAVSSVLASSLPVPVVLDPVLASTSGRALLDVDAIGALKRKLMPLCRLVTPNLPELALLCGRPVTSCDREIVRQAEMLLATGVQAVLVKGGHGNGALSTDLLVTSDGTQQSFEAPRLTGTVRGTGCMLASAIAAHLALGEPLDASIAKAKRHVFARFDAAAAPPS